jgi:hypothetical protein
MDARWAGSRGSDLAGDQHSNGISTVEVAGREADTHLREVPIDKHAICSDFAADTGGLGQLCGQRSDGSAIYEQKAVVRWWCNGRGLAGYQIWSGNRHTFDTLSIPKRSLPCLTAALEQSGLTTSQRRSRLREKECVRERASSRRKT